MEASSEDASKANQVVNNVPRATLVEGDAIGDDLVAEDPPIRPDRVTNTTIIHDLINEEVHNEYLINKTLPIDDSVLLQVSKVEITFIFF